MMKSKRFERYQRRMERAAMTMLLSTAALGALTWMALLDALAAAAW